MESPESSQTSQTDDSESEDETLTHQEAMVIVKKELADIIKNDPLLRDLPAEVTLEEVNSQIALEYGQAMTVNVRRGDNVVMPIVVIQNATVLDLKKAINRYVSLKLSREGKNRPLSWRYTWRTYWLYFEGQKLADDKKLLKDYEIHNRDEVTFIKKLRKK